ncbi:hypothetical protein OROGR_003198 [Orobanche gracilis]
MVKRARSLINPNPEDVPAITTEITGGCYKKGDEVDLMGLLFHQERKHLIKADSSVVYPEHLQGKVIVLHFEQIDSSCAGRDSITSWKKKHHEATLGGYIYRIEVVRLSF